MKVLRQAERELVLRERPWLVWLVGGLFAVSGGFVALRSSDVLFGVAFGILGVGLILAFANTVTCTFDLDAGRFTRLSKGLLRSGQTGHPIDDIVGVRIEQGRARGSRSYRVALVLSTSAQVPLTSSYSTGKKDKEHIAGLIRDLLRLTDPGDVPIPGFVDMFRMMSDPDAARRLSSLYGGLVAEQEEALRRDPDNVEAHRQLATALAMQNRPEEARAHLELARDAIARNGNSRLAAEFDGMLKQLDDARSRAIQ